MSTCNKRAVLFLMGTLFATGICPLPALAQETFNEVKENMDELKKELDEVKENLQELKKNLNESKEDSPDEKREPPELEEVVKLQEYCSKSFLDQKTCPANYCRMGCMQGLEIKDCPQDCLPKPCLELDVKNCPKDTCEILDGCNGKKICYNRMGASSEVCGGLAYQGQDILCCEGFIKRCGIEFFDGTCDMVGQNSQYSVAICLPCGNGICNQFENRCNCPEDCQ